MLVFRNLDTGDNDGRWRRLTSNCVADSATPLAAGSNAIAIFDNSNYVIVGGALANTTVPQGRHLLLLIVDDNGATKHTFGGNPAPCTNANGCPSAMRSTAQVDLFANTLPSSSVTLSVAAP
ncbi:MAG: hypothetical protein ACI9DC_005571 [Gammaproteobacteria bacterium]